ncbi:MAG: HpcH/HpaI aldolase/citrate lyase family protein [Pararhodobacter sp.]
MTGVAQQRSWLFGPAHDAGVFDAMCACAADALILDLEDFTPPPARARARHDLAVKMAVGQGAGKLMAVRINPLEAEGNEDLAAAMAAGAAVIALPMAETAAQIAALDSAIAAHEARLGRAAGGVGILPVCETALGVADLRLLAAASARMRGAILGTEDLAASLCAERSRAGIELAHARGRFLLDCRAAGIAPIDAPYTFTDADGAAAEARAARALGYRAKALVRPDHAAGINAALTPDAAELATARARIAAFEAARARGEDRALVDGLWVELPTYRAALRLLEEAGSGRSSAP